MAIQPVSYFSTTPQQDTNALLGSVRIQTPEQLQAAAEALYGPWFAQQMLELTKDSTLSNTRNTEDQALHQQMFDFGSNEALGQATGAYNQRFGDSFGSPLQQKLEASRLEQQGLQQLGNQRQFQRRQYDIGEILRKGQEQNTQGKQQAIGEYVATNQFSGL